MAESASLVAWLAVWLVAAVFIVVARWSQRNVGAGLVLAYLLNLWLAHWPGAAIYMLPWYSNHPIDVVEMGSQQSAYAVLAFGVGSMILGPALMRLARFRRVLPVAAPRGAASALVVTDIAVGLFCYLVLLPLVGGIPTVTALVAAGLNFVIAGLGLACWHAWAAGKRAAFAGWLVVTLCLPFVTLVTQGFLSYGVSAVLAVLALAASIYRPRWKLVVFALAVGYVGLSFCAAYVLDRGEIRQAVWGGAGLGERVETIYLTARSMEWFDPSDNTHLQRIDTRLNQNYLVGAAVASLDSGSREFASGETLWEALVALVPRALWPDKPGAAGSADLVTRFTGIRFAEGTSVGIGNVMEFYINFGTMGVVVGFLVLGMVLLVVDVMAGRR
ncbi:MAG: hypothetical protein AUI36_40100, partial [Cyanobacteria bacterium 13_1_40CM_2_61_4]